MSDICPTVQIKTAKGFALINESDFDPTKHERFVAPPSAPVVPPPPPLPPIPPHPLDSLAVDWRKRDDLRALAAAVGEGRTVENKAQAIAVIEAALKARAGK